MCAQRDADFYAPEGRLLRDNAGMIAVLGAKMYAAGDTIAIEDSAIDADFRPDEVPVTWRDPDSPPQRPDTGTIQGAEATVEITDETVVKRRLPRTYRHPTLDERLRRERTRQEARLTSEARRLGVPTPVIRDIDPETSTITFQNVGRADLRDALEQKHVETLARHLATIHSDGFVHGDPTTRNVRVGDQLYLIDFGLGYYTTDPEDHAMDLHVLSQSLAGTSSRADHLRSTLESVYATVGDEAVLERLSAIEGRGRYQ
jgi:N6-L-threonylcarbamoyladenine synthase/protein kinase Bud32